MDKVSFELLLVKDIGDLYKVIGLAYSDLIPNCSLIPLRATIEAIELCKKALSENKIVTLSKIIEHAEVLPHELVIEASTDLDRYKQVALNEVRARMHLHMLIFAVVEAMDYLDCFIKLCSRGYVINNSNREDLYFNIISDTQEAEEPLTVSDDATAEEKAAYAIAKKKYENALENLTVLEQYLNYYDNLIETPRRKIRFFTTFRNNILNAKSKEEIDDLLRIYKSNLKNTHMIKVVE